MVGASCRGFTLIELIVAIAVLALLSSMAGLAVGHGSVEASPIEDARRRALQSGTVVYLQDSTLITVLYPDGRSAGPGLDPLTGAVVEPADGHPTGTIR